MDFLLYAVARTLVALIQAMPLTWVARIGRATAVVSYKLDKSHRRVALNNLTLCFGAEKSKEEIEAIAKENFKRLGENYLCAIKTASMDIKDLLKHVEFVGDYGLLKQPKNMIFDIGHFGNFELYARFGQLAPTHQCATTYRALNQPGLNRILLSLREKSGCLFFERRTDAPLLRAAMLKSNLLLGLLADQHASGGVRIPFFGHDCSTSTAPAVLALRYDCRLFTAICYRIAPARWRVEGGAEIPTHENGKPRSSADIMLDVNRAFETAVRRDPANWFWVHKRWKPLKGDEGRGTRDAKTRTAS